MNFLNQNIEDYISPKTSSSDGCILFECDELDCYDFPDEEDVPEDQYVAMITGFRKHKDRYKNYYIDVCYKIFSYDTLKQWENRIIDKISYSYIRTRFVEDGDEHRRFRAAMSRFCNKMKFDSDELIGTISIISLEYRGKGEAVVKKYQETKFSEKWFEDDISDEFYWSAGYTLDED